MRPVSKGFATVLLILALFAVSPWQPVRAAAPEAVAIVYRLEGGASRSVGGSSPKPLGLLDRLAERTRLKAGPGAHLFLAFVTGERFELSGPAKATLGKSDLSARSGELKSLSSVPPLLHLPPLAKDGHPGPTPGAVRIRGEWITGLYPHDGAATLADETYLRFHPVAGATVYRIEVRDGAGRSVFGVDTETSPVKVPAGTLRTGFAYRWTVRTLNRPGTVASGEAKLVTVGEDAARARDETRKLLAPEGPSSLPLLAEIDRGLGLLLEARDDLRTALDDQPGNLALREALSEIEARMECDDDPE